MQTGKNDADDKEYINKNRHFENKHSHESENGYIDEDEVEEKCEKDNKYKREKAIGNMSDNNEEKMCDSCEDKMKYDIEEEEEEQDNNSDFQNKKDQDFINNTNNNNTNQDEGNKLLENYPDEVNECSENSLNSEYFENENEFKKESYSKEGPDNEFYDSKLKCINEISLYINVLNEIQIKNNQFFSNLKETFNQEDTGILNFCLNFSFKTKNK